MKQTIVFNLFLYMLTFLLVCVIIYPHTRFAHKEPLHKLGGKHLNKSHITLKVGESFFLYISGFNRRVFYKSSDFKVAKVSFTGKVTAVRKGTAVITVTQKDIKLTCKVTVKE